MLYLGALVAKAATVPVPADLAREDGLWALLPLVEGARDPLAQGVGRDRTRYVVTVDLLEDVVVLKTAPEPLGPDKPRQLGPRGLLPDVQERDDGYRQRRRLVERYVAYRNEAVDPINRLDPGECAAAIERHRRAIAEMAEAVDAERETEVRIELEDALLRVLAMLKTAEARHDAPLADAVGAKAMKALSRAIELDALEVRLDGIIDALALDLVSPASEAYSWGSTYNVVRCLDEANLSERDFFEWAWDVTGQNQKDVKKALSHCPETAQAIEGAESTQGSYGGPYPRVLDVLRERGHAMRRDGAARGLYGQSAEGVKVRGRVSDRPVLQPRGGKGPKRLG